MMDRLPDFFIIGVERGGTSSVWATLEEHPKLQAGSKKEIRYFSQKYEKGLSWYESFFSERKRGCLIFNGSPNYLYSEKAPLRIKSILPNSKFIVLLRNPIWRAWSQYCVYRDKIGSPKQLKNTSRNIVKRGIYVTQFRRWFSYFSRDRFLILRSEDYFISPSNTIKRIQEWLEVEYFSLDNKYWDPLMTRKKKLGQPKIPLQVFNFLKAFYKPYNKELYNLLGKNFGWELKT